jgi:AmmeMemoRadiSam system protein B
LRSKSLVAEQGIWEVAARLNALIMHATTPIWQAGHHPDCYPSDPGRALAFFREVLQMTSGEKLPEPPEGADLVGIVTPHIDFRVSLRSYAAAFRPLLDEPLAETYIILGVGHRSPLEWNLDRSDYMTPLGRAECARDLVDALASGGSRARHFHASSHENEHSIEFPLVWLQALQRFHPEGNEKPVRFVPLLCGGLHRYVAGHSAWEGLTEFHRLGEALSDVLKAGGDRIRVIVSIDGCHMGPRFEHPFRVTPALLKRTESWENELWNQVAGGDARRFLDWMREQGNERYFDGVGALALLLAAGGGALTVQRTFYEQWFTPRDASVVTFSSGRVLRPAAPR